MQPRHARAVNALEEDARDYLRWYFDLARRAGPSSVLLSEQLAQCGFGQADVVLALLRAGMISAAESVVGRRVVACPPCLSPGLAPLAQRDDEHQDRRRIRFKREVPQVNRGGRLYRLALLRDGMTVEQFLTRGGHRRDLSYARRRGILVLEERR